jgi:DNA-binding MarR family transcriptional regulator
MSQVKKFIKFTEMLADAERELGISHLGELDKHVVYIIQKSALSGKTVSFEEINNLMDTPRATLYRHVQALVQNGVLKKEKDPNDGRRNIISVSL